MPEILVNSPPTLSQEIKIGLAGLGNVGAGVYKNLQRNGDLLAERTGARFVVQKIAVHDPSKDRGFTVPEGVLTTHWQDLVEDPEIDIIVELIGGVAEASRLVRAALMAKKMVSSTGQGCSRQSWSQKLLWITSLIRMVNEIRTNLF